MRRPLIAALILAAGLSSRSSPRHKLFVADESGTTMIARTADNVLASAAEAAIVVTGHRSVEIRAALGARPLAFVHAPDYARGLSASLRAGIDALPHTADAVLICLADMPLVTPATLNRIIAAHDPNAGRLIVVPTYNGRRGNPVLWNRRFFPELRALTGDQGGRQLFAPNESLIVECRCADDSVLRDFDEIATP